MGYSMNMGEEKKPKIKKLLPQGWRDFTIFNGREATSKSGNEMFVFSVRDKETGYEEEIYAIATPKKRWFLKALLDAVGIVPGPDGEYRWDISDVVGKEFKGLVEHEPNDWINRDGETVHGTQHKITDIRDSWLTDNEGELSQ